MAKMSDVKMSLTEAQYVFMIGLSQTIPRAFSSEEAEDDDYSLPPAPATPTPVTSTDPNLLETVDLLPELGMTAKRSDGVLVPLSSSLELVFDVGTVYMELFTSTAVSTASLRDASLAKFSLNETGVRYKMLSNGSMEAEVIVRSFTVHDTRTSRQTKFREIIPATSHDGHQFMINFTQSGGTDQSAFANVTIDSPKIIFSLDPLFALLDYFTSPFNEQLDVAEPATDLPVAAATPTEGRTFAYRVNVVSPTIILLDNPERADSEAVILSISQIQMSQQGTLALTASKIGMFLCKVGPFSPVC